MILFEKTIAKSQLDDIAVDYEMLEMEGLPVEKPEVVLYFNSDRVLDSVDDVIMPIQFKLEGLEKKACITIAYTCDSFDDTFDISKLDDDAYEVEELPDGYMVTVDDPDKLSKVLNATFTQSVVYPFDNTSKNDAVNKYLEKDNIDLSTKIAKYITDLVYKVDEYKSIHSSWSNQQTRATKKAVAANAIRAGRTDLQMLLDTLKTLKGVKRIQEGTLATGSRFKHRYRVFATVTKMVKYKPVQSDEVFEVLSDNSGKHFVCKLLNDAFNGAELYSPESVIRWFKNRLGIKQADIKSDAVSDDDTGWGAIRNTADSFTHQN